jgi:hypothetical protein
MPRGQQSNGVNTERGRLTIIGASTTNGSRTFSPILPGIETQEDWDEHLAGIRLSLSPVGHLENELAYKVALALRQWHRLDRYERAATVQAMEEASEEPFSGDEVKTVMEAGVQALKERTALAGRLIELATVCPSMEPGAPIAPSEGRLLLCAAFAGELKKKANLEEPPIEEPPHWTWGAVQEGLSELAAATGKPVERILLAVCRHASEQREVAEATLKAGVPKLELALVQHGTALTNESLMLLSGTKRPARARERLTGYLRFGILVTDHRSLATAYIGTRTEDSCDELLPAYMRRQTFSEAEIHRFFETLGRHETRAKRSERGLSCFELLHWTRVFAEIRKALQQTTNARSGFQRRSETGKKTERNSLDA